MTDLGEILLSSTGYSVIACGILVWLFREWISDRFKKSIQQEYDVKREGLKAGYQKVLDKNRIVFCWWYDAQVKAIQETYFHIEKLSFCIDNKLLYMEQRKSCFTAILQ